MFIQHLMSLKNKIAQTQSRLTITKKHGLKMVIGLVGLGIIIGSTYTYCYLELTKTKTVKFIIENTEVAQAFSGDKISPDMGAVVSTASHLDSVATGSSQNPQEDVIELIKQTFPEEPEMMVKIAKWESSLRPEAINNNKNGTQDCGLLQVNSIHGYDCKWLLDVNNNLKVARKIYDTQGKQAWVSYNTAVTNGII
jgi:hypothetical protein